MSQLKFVIECDVCKLEKEADVEITENSRICKGCLPTLWNEAKDAFENLIYNFVPAELKYLSEYGQVELGLNVEDEEDIEAIPPRELPECLYKSFRIVEAFFKNEHLYKK
jgi:hypothetical protein